MKAMVTRIPGFDRPLPAAIAYCPVCGACIPEDVADPHPVAHSRYEKGCYTGPCKGMDHMLFFVRPSTTRRQ